MFTSNTITRSQMTRHTLSHTFSECDPSTPADSMFTAYSVLTEYTTQMLASNTIICLQTTHTLSHMFVERKPSALSYCTFSELITEQAPFLAKRQSPSPDSSVIHESCGSCTDHVAVDCQPAHPLLSSTELRKLISSGSDSFQFFHSSKMFANNTKLL